MRHRGGRAGSPRTGLGRLWPALAGACLAAWAVPGAAVEWEWGEVHGRLDSFFSISASMRVEGADCERIPNLPGVRNNPGGCNDPLDLVTQGELLNSDDGNLNWDEWDVFSVLFKASHDLELRWRNYGSFLRVSYFTDAIQANETSPDRTNLSQDARYRSSVLEGGVVGVQFLVLDAYGYADFDFADRHFTFRAGNQVVNWGESTFTQGGVNATNTFDVARIRLAGSELREALLPAPMLLLGGDIVGNLGFEAYYQFGWRRTEIDPVGTFFSVNDLVGRGAEGFFTPFTLCGVSGVPQSDCADPGASGFSADKLFDQSFAAGGAPRARDREARDQGQWGLALRYYVDAIETELAAYYIRLHAKEPSISFRGQCPAGVTGNACLLQPRVISYFREYPNDIDLYGVSFNTVIAGISFGGEVSWRHNEPVQTASALPDLTSAIQSCATVEPDERCVAATSGFMGEESGFSREDRIVGILNALYVAGPGTPGLGRLLRFIGAADMTLLAEVGILAFPSLEGDVDYATPLGVDRVDDDALSYTVRVEASYDRVFGSAVTLKPGFAFRHDVFGVGPGNGSLFTEGVKQLTLQLEANYQERWKGILSYNNWFGAETRNPNNDRDFVSMSISYAF